MTKMRMVEYHKGISVPEPGRELDYLVGEMVGYHSDVVEKQEIRQRDGTWEQHLGFGVFGPDNERTTVVTWSTPEAAWQQGCPLFSTDWGAALRLFEMGLLRFGSAALFADMEEYDDSHWVTRIGEVSLCAPLPAGIAQCVWLAAEDERKDREASK